MKTVTRMAFMLCAVLVLEHAANGQHKPQASSSTYVRSAKRSESPASPRADLRVDVPLILTTVHVTSPLGNTVTDLRQENFRLFEDGVEQSVSHFALEDAPVSIGLVFDSSGSMRTKIQRSAEAVAAFLKVANPEDEFFLVEFGDRPKLSVDFTRDANKIRRRIAHAEPFGRTSLLDAIHLALAKMKQAPTLRKAIVIFSDGGDNCSRRSEGEIKTAMIESDVQVYALGIFSDPPKRSRDELNGPLLLTELADQTGGKHYPIENLEDLPQVCSLIGNELRTEYVLGYLSTNSTRDGRYRHIKVVLDAPGRTSQLKPYYRLGYYAPQE